MCLRGYKDILKEYEKDANVPKLHLLFFEWHAQYAHYWKK